MAKRKAKKRGKRKSSAKDSGRTSLKHSILLAEQRTHLAQKRTELAHERTVMANVRTATTLILFGIAFFGLSRAKQDFFYFSGIVSIILGVFFAFFALERALKHFREIEKIKKFFENLLRKI